MSKKRMFTTVVAGLFMLFTSVAYAGKHNQDAAAFFFLSKTKISLPQLIDKVEKTEAGQVLSLRMKTKNSQTPCYEMHILKNEKDVEVEVEPESGKILKTESDGFFSNLFHEKKAIPATLQVTLKDAIAIVEKEYTCKVLAGELDRDDNVTGL